MTVSSFRPALIVLGVIAVFIAVTTVVMAMTTAQRGGSIGLLIDISPSSQGSTKDEIISCAQDAVSRAVKDGAVLMIAPVAGSSVHMTSSPITSKLSLSDRLTLERAKKIQKRAKATAKQHVSRVLDGPVREDSSDTVAATAIMAKELQTTPGPRYLVVCGDAHQVSPGFNMYREKLTPTRSRQLVKIVAEDLGDLSDIDVIFGAAGLDTRVALTHAREEAIARWWKDYWAPAVGVRSLTYGPELRLPN